MTEAGQLKTMLVINIVFFIIQLSVIGTLEDYLICIVVN